MRRRTYLLTTTGFVGLVAGCLGDDDTETEQEDLEEEATIEIIDVEYTPRRVQIESGGRVTWTNESDGSYRIDSFQFHTGSTSWSFSETLEPGSSVTYTFDEAGLYDFTDQGHGQFSMCGRVQVGHVEDDLSLPCE
ncbi:cupredoxin domain-containing protein [Natrialbaceae archaeon A-chndr2]